MIIRNTAPKEKGDLPCPLVLTRRYQRQVATTEITSIGISFNILSKSATAFSTYTTAQTGQSWIDSFDLYSQKNHAKITGSHAVLGPLLNGKGSIATLRDRTVPVGQGAQYHHGSTLLVKDYLTGKTAREFKEAVNGPVAWSLDGIAIAAGEGKGRMGVWDARTGARVGRVLSHIDEITHAAFTPDHKLVTIARDGWMRLTDPKTAKTIKRNFVMGLPATNPSLLAVAPNGNTVISVWGMHVVKWFPYMNSFTVYQLEQARSARGVIEGWPLCVSPDTAWILCRTEEGFDIVDSASGAILWETHEDIDMTNMVTCAAISADKKILLLGRMNGMVEAWDIEETNPA